MKQQTVLKQSLATIMIGIALFLNGGFFDDAVAFIGSLIAILLFVLLFSGANFYKRDARYVFLIPSCLFCIAAIVCFWSVDYMENIMGVMRIGVICLWMWFLRVRDKEELSLAYRSIPLLGCVNMLIALISFPISGLAPRFWENNRMSGFFQYANTNALFLALGLIILIYEWKDAKRKAYVLAELVFLMVGILLTGSRSVLLLLFLWGCWYALKTKEFRKPLLIGSGGFLVLGGAFVALTGYTENVGRIFTIFTSNSTLWGRLLYYRDAILLLCKKPLGLGRLGYYYTQGTFQTGVYHIRFVHNDFLQIALDYGMVALVLVLIFLWWQIMRGRQSREYKEVLIFLLLASLVDFHCQYLVILMICCILFDYGNGEKEKKHQLRENYVILPVLTMMLVYVGIAAAGSRTGNLSMTLSMLPGYTAAQEKGILHTMGTPQSYELAEQLLKKNPYNITAYIAKASFLSSQFAIEESIEALDMVRKLDPYNIEYYEQSENILKTMLKGIEDSEFLVQELQISEEDKTLLKSKIDALPGELAAMEARTSPLAYKIKDKPEFSYK